MSAQAPPSFLPSPYLPPAPGLGSTGKLISDTQTPPVASSTAGTENRGVRGRVLKINSWASPSPADWLSGPLWVSFKFVVATATGQGMERERGQFPALDTGASYGEAGTKHSLPFTPQGKHLNKKILFLESSDLSPPSSSLSHYITPWGQKLPCNHPHPSSTRRAERGTPDHTG